MLTRGFGMDPILLARSLISYTFFFFFFFMLILQYECVIKKCDHVRDQTLYVINYDCCTAFDVHTYHVGDLDSIRS